MADAERRQKAKGKMGPIQITVNSQKLEVALHNFTSALRPEPLLKIAGGVMRGSIEQTFRDQGSPAGSWAPLAASTIRRDRTAGVGRKILIRSSRLKNSVTSAQAQTINGNTLVIGSNLIYAATHQFGRGRIPQREFLKFRPEDPERMTLALEAYIAAQAKGAGL
jgi:phage virion morphogenesis protein